MSFISKLRLHSNPGSFFGRSWWIEICVLLLLLAVGLGLRLINYTQPPVDVHGWRQLRSAGIARSIYYDIMQNPNPEMRGKAHYLGAVYGVMEPLLLENLTAYTYLVLGSEQLWVARFYSILFWMIGGLALYALGRRMTSPDGGMLALGFYLLLPFAVVHSRTFMPEPLMVMWMLLAVNAVYRWQENTTWKWTLLAGIACGMAILVKVFVVFPVAISTMMLLVSTWGIRRMLTEKKLWVFVGLSALIPAAYYFFGMPGRAGDYVGTWVTPYLHLLKDPLFYMRWLHSLTGLFNLAVIVAALASLTLFAPRPRALVGGLWIGYFVFGASVPELINSHIYYNLVLTPIIALSLSPLFALVLGKVANHKWFWQVVFLGALLIGLGDTAYLARKDLRAVDYSQEPAFWQDLSTRLPNDGDIIGLSEDYNTRMAYYGWRYINYYPFSYDQDMGKLGGATFTSTDKNLGYFKKMTSGNTYFLVTVMSEFDAQPDLKEILYNNYPIVMQGERYVLFDLRHPKN